MQHAHTPRARRFLCTRHIIERIQRVTEQLYGTPEYQALPASDRSCLVRSILCAHDKCTPSGHCACICILIPFHCHRYTHRFVETREQFGIVSMESYKEFMPAADKVSRAKLEKMTPVMKHVAQQQGFSMPFTAISSSQVREQLS